MGGAPAAAVPHPPAMGIQLNMAAAAQLIVALDVRSEDEATAVVDRLPSEIAYYKVGLELFCAHGPATLDALARRGKRVFLDLKLHDIPRTVARAVRVLCQSHVALLSLHVSGGRAMLTQAAAEARNCPELNLIGITLLTSLDEADLASIGVARGSAEHTQAMGALAVDCGLDGLVCSVREVPELRKRLGPRPLLVTPGVRPTAGPHDDQKRVGTVTDAVRGGANYLVVGRPILEAPHPVRAAEHMLREIESITGTDQAQATR